MRCWTWSALAFSLLIIAAGCSGDSPSDKGETQYGSTGLVPFGGLEGSAPKSTNSSITSGAGGPGVPGISQPPGIVYNRPADIVVKHEFEKDGTKLEVLGICKMNETEVQCWSADGALDPELAKKVATGLQTKDVTGQPPRFSTLFNRKNRLVIIRNQSGKSALEPRIVNWELGSLRPQSYGLISIPGVTDINSSGAWIDGTQARMVTESLDAKLTVAYFVYQEPIRGSAELECQVGKSVTLDGMAFTVKGIKKMMDTAWFIQVETDAKSLKGLSITFTPLDKEGKTFEWVNGSGVPISEKERLALQNTDRASQVQYSTPKTSRVKNNFEVLTLVDPRYIGSLAIRGYRTTQGKIEDIPMDPK